MRTMRITSLAAVAILVVGAAPVWAAEITGNGGFEIAGANGPTDSAMWSEFANGAPGVPGTASTRDATHPASGSWAHHLVAFGGDGIGSVAGITQNSVGDVGLGTLVAGSTLSVSFDYIGNFGPGGVMNYALRILNRYGGIVDQTMGTLVNPTGGVYQTYSTSVLTVPALGAEPNDLYAAYFEINAAAGGFLASTCEVYVDNVHINGSVVPEPASLALLGLTALVIRRR